MGNTQAKDAAEKITSFFNEILPQMDSLATKNQVVFPILGTQEYAAAETTAVVEEEMESTPVEDSLDTVALVEEPATRTAESYSDEVYLKHVQEQVAVVKEHFRRLSRNTNRELRDFAQSKTETVAELFTAVGGEEGAGTHH